MMQLSNIIQLENLHFLPVDGEDRVEMEFTGGCLTLKLYYTNEKEASVRRDLRFSAASYFLKTPFPGSSVFDCAEDRNLELLDSLVAYEYSAWLDNARAHHARLEGRHYRIFLHSAGIAIHVIAAGYELSAELRVVPPSA
ncbi:hypothetical protein [Rhodoferax sp. OV413]|uniref:hypothetical protein n=1 Tax=Rhodoferax sp. OV413 TaxID=1855285 RepID=UPI00115FA305|nr:hypothetical protein [Rhodoferax sp. OV413]